MIARNKRPIAMSRVSISPDVMSLLSAANKIPPMMKYDERMSLYLNFAFSSVILVYL